MTETPLCNRCIGRLGVLASAPQEMEEGASACASRDPRVYLCPGLSIMVVSRSLVVRGAAVARAEE